MIKFFKRVFFGFKYAFKKHSGVKWGGGGIMIDNDKKGILIIEYKHYHSMDSVIATLKTFKLN